MSAETNKQVARRFYDDVLNGRNVDVLDELAVPDYEEHDMMPGQGTGLAGLRDRVNIFINGLDPHFTVEDVIAEGDKVVVRWTSAGTHSGDFVGIPATGKSYTTAGIDIYRLAEGKLAEHWHVVDQLTLLQQLGVIPSPG